MAFSRTDEVKYGLTEIGPTAVREDAERTYVPRGEGQEAGWIRIGRYDSARRRALWLRFHNLNVDGLVNTCDGIELCAGREGDDAHVLIKSDNPIFEDLLDCMLRASDHIPARWGPPTEPTENKK